MNNAGWEDHAGDRADGGWRPLACFDTIQGLWCVVVVQTRQAHSNRGCKGPTLPSQTQDHPFCEFCFRFLAFWTQFPSSNRHVSKSFPIRSHWSLIFVYECQVKDHSECRAKDLPSRTAGLAFASQAQIAQLRPCRISWTGEVVNVTSSKCAAQALSDLLGWSSCQW